MAYVARTSPDRRLLGGGDGSGASSAPGALDAAAPAPTQSGSGSGFAPLSAYLAANGDAAQQMASSITNPIEKDAGAAAANWLPVNDQQATVDARNTARAGALSKMDTLSSPEGQEEFLRDRNGPNYTPGMASLDSAMLGDMSGLKAKWSGLLSPMALPVRPTYPTDGAHPSAPAPPRTPEPPPDYQPTVSGLSMPRKNKGGW